MKFNKSDYRLAIYISVIYAIGHQIFRYLEGIYYNSDWGAAWTNLKFFSDF
ncbi:hypothetical protein KIH41_13345 [Litoribacter ruber]|uniref:hypothetical protein n=1 Tax=Litoribacter ruber TaxID=702568 RepID=UPI001BDAC600|nr:hypothetical protein [Litoribacter ruber]MBT0812265.1 hypothetical protein [Litoribacter ruber]